MSTNMILKFGKNLRFFEFSFLFRASKYMWVCMCHCAQLKLVFVKLYIVCNMNRNHTSQAFRNIKSCVEKKTNKRK